jgi:hypothetical protein
MARIKPSDLRFRQVKLRVREKLRARLEQEAEKNGHSLNAEAVATLERGLLLPSIETIVFRLDKLEQANNNDTQP